MLERVAVGFDGSAPSRRASDYAVEVAGRFAARLTLLIVRSDRGPPVDPRLENLVPGSEDGRPIAGVIEEVCDQARASGARSVEVVYLTGDAVEEIVRWARRHPQDLLVVGSRGLSPGRRVLLGSVSAGLVARAPCPVLVVRGPHVGRPVPRAGKGRSVGGAARVRT